MTFMLRLKTKEVFSLRLVFPEPLVLQKRYKLHSKALISNSYYARRTRGVTTHAVCDAVCDPMFNAVCAAACEPKILKNFKILPVRVCHKESCHSCYRSHFC